MGDLFLLSARPVLDALPPAASLIADRGYDST